jgi:hypothetical protein
MLTLYIRGLKKAGLLYSMGAKESKAGAPPTRHQQESVIFFFCRASRGRK